MTFIPKNCVVLPDLLGSIILKDSKNGSLVVMGMIIDFHTHVYPIPKWTSMVQKYRQRSRELLEPTKNWTHLAQQQMRFLPGPLGQIVEEVGILTLVPNLSIESSVEDLKESMENNSVSKSLVVAHPPIISNEFVLETCETDPSLYPCVNIGPNTTSPGELLKTYHQKGVHFLKIHPITDGLQPMSSHYLELLKTADELGIHIILHTGIINSHVFFRRPELGDIKMYESWFELFPNINFLLAHMNFNQPEEAISICEKHKNTSIICSWQPLSSITHAVDRIGAERIIYGSDWPLLGNNMSIVIQRIQQGRRNGNFSSKEADLILGGNAAKLLPPLDH